MTSPDYARGDADEPPPWVYAIACVVLLAAFIAAVLTTPRDAYDGAYDDVPPGECFEPQGTGEPR